MMTVKGSGYLFRETVRTRCLEKVDIRYVRSTVLCNGYFDYVRGYSAFINFLSEKTERERARIKGNEAAKCEGCLKLA
jgi:hypothetical protein